MVSKGVSRSHADSVVFARTRDFDALRVLESACCCPPLYGRWIGCPPRGFLDRTLEDLSDLALRSLSSFSDLRVFEHRQSFAPASGATDVPAPKFLHEDDRVPWSPSRKGFHLEIFEWPNFSVPLQDSRFMKKHFSTQ